MSNHVERLAFGIDQVCQLTGLTRRQVKYWDDTRFFAPEYDETRRVYSFRDVVGLRTIAQLRKTVPLQELRRIGEWLQNEHETPWSSLRFYRAGRTVYFRDPRTGSVVSTNPKDQLVCIALEEVATEVRELIEQRRRRSLSTEGRVERDRQVVRNQPVIAGTRIPVAAIKNFHDAGYTVEEILGEYPSITRLDVEAALSYQPERRVG